jgi:transglutaminase-like putative cysteine protease
VTKELNNFAGFDKNEAVTMWLVRHRPSAKIVIIFGLRAFAVREVGQIYFHAAVSEVNVEAVDEDFGVEVDSIVVVRDAIGVREYRVESPFTWPAGSPRKMSAVMACLEPTESDEGASETEPAPPLEASATQIERPANVPAD